MSGECEQEEDDDDDVFDFLEDKLLIQKNGDNSLT